MIHAAAQARGGRARLARLRPSTLRRKIVVGVLVMLVLSFLLVAAVTAFAMHKFLIDRLEQLVAAGSRFSVGLEHPDDHDADNDAGQFQTVSGQADGTLVLNCMGQLMPRRSSAGTRRPQHLVPGHAPRWPS